MSNKTYRLLDLEEEEWLISPGDPAHSLLDRLNKMGWRPRLPARLLATGRMEDWLICEAIETLQMLEAEATTLPDGTLDELILDAHRTLRQLRYLKEGGGI